MPFNIHKFNVAAQFFDGKNDWGAALFGVWIGGRQAGWGEDDLPG